MDGMEGQGDTFKEDVKEHKLDIILADIVVEPMKVADDAHADWETAAHADLASKYCQNNSE